MILPLTTCIVLSTAPLAPAAAQLPIESPALRALASSTDDTGAVRRFWSGRRAADGPLIESVPGDSLARLVTFVWKGANQRTVAVITPFSLIDIELSRMQRLAGTDVWFRSYRMRADAVMMYRFGPDDSMVPFSGERNLARRMSAWRTDPLNPATFEYADGTRGSVLRIRTAPGESIRSMRSGHILADTLPGNGTWPDQPIFVYVPPADTAAAQHPLLVLMDGDSYLRLMDAPSILDSFGSAMPERSPIAVFVPVEPARRTMQYACNPDWSDFLARTLVPYIENRLETSARPADRIIGGYSLGGLAAACAAIRHPDVFGNVLAQSGSFYRPTDGDQPEGVARELARSPVLPIRWNLSIGLLETAAIPSADPSMLTANRHLRDILRAKGYDFDYQEFFGGHEQVAWGTLLPDALTALLLPRR